MQFGCGIVVGALAVCLFAVWLTGRRQAKEAPGPSILEHDIPMPGDPRWEPVLVECTHEPECVHLAAGDVQLVNTPGSYRLVIADEDHSDMHGAQEYVEEVARRWRERTGNVN